MNIPGLSVQEGFMSNLLSSNYLILDQPALQKLEESTQNNNLLVLTDPGTETGKKLAGKLPENDGMDKP